MGGNGQAFFGNSVAYVMLSPQELGFIFRHIDVNRSGNIEQKACFDWIVSSLESHGTPLEEAGKNQLWYILKTEHQNMPYDFDEFKRNFNSIIASAADQTISAKSYGKSFGLVSFD